MIATDPDAPSGRREAIEVDVRVIGATNADLPAEAEAGRFRHDLLDRLAFDVLTLPPLRARREDISLLADHFGRAMAQELDWTGFPGFGEAALADLLDYAWPGNVRELRNVVERAVADEEILRKLGIPEFYWNYVAESWRKQDRNLYGG